METEIVFCERCGVSIPEGDLPGLRQASGGRDLCRNCTAVPAGGDLRLYFCENCRVSIAVTDVLTKAAVPEGPGWLCSPCSRSTPAERMARRTAVEREMAAPPPGAPAPPTDPIYFCDACNSSIPATLVATGRALVKGGRTYCERCRARVEAASVGARPGVGFLPVLAAALLAAAGTAAGLALRDAGREEDRARERDSALDSAVADLRREMRAARTSGETARETVERLDRAQKDLERKLDGIRVEAMAARAAADRAAAAATPTEKLVRLERWIAELQESQKVLREDVAMLAAERSKAAPPPPPPAPAPSEGTGMDTAPPPAPDAGGGDAAPAGPSPQVQRCIALLEDKDAGVRFSAAIELGKLGDRSAWQALAKRLRTDDDTFVRRACARSIGELKAYDAFPDLVEALGDGEEYVAIQASRVIKEMAGQDFGFKQSQVKGDRKKVADRAKSWWNDNKDRLAPGARKPE